jgi:hypothetical protein
MATNKSKAKSAVKPTDAKHNPNRLEVVNNTDETKADALARKVIMPSVTGAVTMQAFKKNFGEVDLMALIKATQVQIKAVQDGDMNRTEEMLITQTHTLDAIFNELARRAIGSDTMSKLEIYLRLGLKAQSQCRTTLEALAEIKNPQPTAFIKQQNVGFNQQVNNGTTANASHGKIKNQPNELLTEWGHHGTTLDTGRTGAAIGADKELEAVGAVNRG